MTEEKKEVKEEKEEKPKEVKEEKKEEKPKEVKEEKKEEKPKEVKEEKKEEKPKEESKEVKKEVKTEFKKPEFKKPEFKKPEFRERRRFGRRRDDATEKYAGKIYEKKEQKKVETIIPLFDKWKADEVKITDISLANYINLSSKKIPHSFGRTKIKVNQSLVERLVNKLMRSGQGKRKLSGKYMRGRKSCGKKLQAMKIVEDAFESIEKQTKQNPLQVLVQAIEHSAPREDITRIKRGGVTYTLAVDVAPKKRIDESVKNLALAAYAQSFNNKTLASQALAKEIMLASKEDATSFSIKRRNEIERIAASSR